MRFDLSGNRRRYQFILSLIALWGNAGYLGLKSWPVLRYAVCGIRYSCIAQVLIAGAVRLGRTVVRYAVYPPSSPACLWAGGGEAAVVRRGLAFGEREPRRREGEGRGRIVGRDSPMEDPSVGMGTWGKGIGRGGEGLGARHETVGRFGLRRS